LHSAPASPNYHDVYHHDPIFGKLFDKEDSPADSTAPVLPTFNHKHLPKLDFPKFSGDNPKIWRKQYEIYFDVFSIPESLHTRFDALNFVDHEAPWFETVEARGKIDKWYDLCALVSERWGRDQH
jgi:hypothetical protein